MFFNSKSLMPSNHIRISAWLEHAPFAFWLMDVLKPRTVVELGTHNGFSFLSMCQAAKSAELNTTIYAVDTWRGDEHAGFYASDVYDALETELRTQYPGIGVLIRSTFSEARSQFADGSVDLLHIDGRHRYEDVVEDFENWKTVLSDRSIVLFHDTCVQHTDFGVWKFWKEIQSQYPTFEFYHGNGLGVLMWGKNAPQALLKLHDSGFEEMQLTRETYARLGHLNSILYQLGVANSHNHSVLQECGLTASDLEKFHSNTSELGRIIKDKYEAEKVAISEHWQNQQSGITRHYENRISELEKNIERNSSANAQILDELTAEREKNNAILTSKSWRMTKPYRHLGRQGRRAVHITKAMPSIVHRAGGLKAFSSKAYETLRDEGISGLKRRWIRANTPGNQVQVSAGGKIVDRNDYSEWVRLYSSVDGTSRKKIRKSIKAMAVKPKISIVMPAYNPNLNWLHEAVNSVSSQLYDNWELCIADDCSSNPEVKNELEALQKRDARIRVVFRPQNGHISAASNSAIELATGDWLALMDQDDLLTEDALYHVAQIIVSNPEARLIYSDEDKINEDGKRFDPYFKPDWNPDLFLSHNMICHLGAYHRETVQQLGGFREGYEGAQDYDLALRITETLNTNQIVHIPRVLYHWRSHAESTAQAGSNKNYALLAGQKTLDDHFQRTGIEARTELLDFGRYRVHYALPEDAPLVSLIIPTRNGLALTKQCIDSILEKTTYPNYEIVLVDNNSDEPEALAYFETLKEHGRIKVLRDERPFNYSALNNNAVEHANGDYVALINNDIEVISPDWLSEMMSIALQPGVGAVGARLWYPNDTLQHGGVIIGLGGVAGHSHKSFQRDALGYFGRAQLIQSLSAVTAACLVVSKEIYSAVGGLNEKELTVAFNDVDFCLKVRAAGYRNVWTPYAELYHHESATRGFENTPEKLKRFQEEIKYMERVWDTGNWSDPAYSPNLTLDREDFSFAWPPRLRG